MDLRYFWFIVISALLPAFYNFLMRKAGGDEGFLLTMFVVATGMAAAIVFWKGGLTAIPYVFNFAK